MIKWSIYISIIFFSASNILAQELNEDLGNTSDDLKDTQIADSVGPKTNLAPPARFFQLSYLRNGPSSFSGLNTSNNALQKYEEIYAKLKYPVLLKEKTRIIGGFQYRYHEYNLRTPEVLSDTVLNYLDNKHLNRIRADFYVTHNFSDSRYMMIKTGFQLGGDYQNENYERKEFLKFATTGLFGFRVSPRFSWGLGIYFSTQGESISLYPAIAVDYWKNEKWGIRSAFPINLNLIYRASDYKFLSFGYAISSTKYLIDFNELNYSRANNLAVLARRDLQVFGEYQTRLVGFLWGALTVGANANLNLRLENSFRANAAVVYSNQLSFSPFIETSIFLTIPEKLRNR